MNNTTTTTTNTEARKPLSFNSTLSIALRNAYWERGTIKLIVNKKDGVELMDVKVKGFLTEVMVEVSQELYSKTITFDLYLDSVVEYEYKGRSRKR